MKLLRGLFNKKDAFSIFNLFISSDYQFSTLEKEILSFITDYVTIHETMPTMEYVFSEHQRRQRSDILSYLEDLKTDPEYSLSDIQDYIIRVTDSAKDESLSDILKKGKAIARHGETINGKKLEGRQDAISFIERELEKLKGSTGRRDKNAGRLKHEIPNIITRYDFLKNNPSARYGLTTGYKALDDAFKGGRKKELYLLLGWTGSGKSIFTVNYFYNVTHVLRRDAVFYSLEMPEEYVMAMLCAIHSASEKFDAIRPGPNPLRVTDITEAMLSPEEEKFYKDIVLKDLLTNPNYGNLIIRYPGDTFTFDYMRDDMAQLGKELDLEMFGVDHPQLIRPEKGNRQPHGEFMNEVMKDLKQVCMTWKNGDGIFGFCPYQASRNGFTKAMKNGGFYDLTDASYSNEAERSADGFWSIWRDPGMSDIRLACMKFRRGRPFDPITLACNFESTYITEKEIEEKPDIDPLIDFDIFDDILG